MTPLQYLIPTTEVPVTMGLRVRSVALKSDEEVEEGARGAPPADRERDII